MARVADVCSGTGAGPTREYYLNRPVVNGADDRGGAMALLAALEMERAPALKSQRHDLGRRYLSRATTRRA